MNVKKITLFLFLSVPVFINISIALEASSLYSPTWGFYLDLPEDYEYSDGDRRDRFSFVNPDGAAVDIVIYAAEQGSQAPYSSVYTLAQDVQQRLNSSGDTDFFDYANTEAAILELIFPNPADRGRTIMTGWGLALELGSGEQGQNKPLLLALAYGPQARQDLQILHLSVLDSIAPTEAQRRYPGPITEYSYPRETRVNFSLWGLGEEASFYLEDEEASQALINREFNVLKRYADTPIWEDAWIRYYRAIYRDSCDRLANAAFIVERKLNYPVLEKREFAGKVLNWIQQFTYERDFLGADFISLVSSIRDGRGDCDNLAMLWALILNRTNIPAAMMVSREYSHAMGLADLSGSGARFEFAGRQWLVAETTAPVDLGLIGSDVSDTEYWLGIILE